MIDDPGFRRFLEAELRRYTVLVSISGQAVETGFFISTDGLVCTSFHPFVLRDEEELSVSWGEQTYPALLAEAQPDLDFALLQIAVDGAETPVAPVATVPPGDSSHHPAATLGFAGLEHPPEELALAARLYVGELASAQVYEGRRRIEFLDLGVGRGNSGAAVLDLRSLRIVGLLTGVPAGLRRLGDCVSIEHLTQLRPDLVDQWAEAGTALDRACSRWLGEISFPPDPVEVPPHLGPYLADEQLQRVREDYQERGIFDPALSVPRAAEAELDAFVDQPRAPLLAMAGLAGSGKSNLLLGWISRLPHDRFVPVLVPCRHLDRFHLLPAIFEALGVATARRGGLELFLRATPERTWVLVLDGLSEWPHFSRDRIEASLTELVDAASRVEPTGRLRVVLSFRSEFLQDHLPELLQPTRPRGRLWDHFFDPHPREGGGGPFLELRLDPDTSSGAEELRTIYEHYRAVGQAHDPAGREFGIRPRTTFDQLSPVQREVLSRPVILSLVMRAYHGRELPREGLGPSLVDEILGESLGDSGRTDLFRFDAAEYLGQLAWHLVQEGLPGSCRYSVLRAQTWHDRAILETLLTETSILVRLDRARVVAGEEPEIAFRAEWFAEYFLARHLLRLLQTAPVEARRTIRGILGRPGDEPGAASAWAAVTLLAQRLLYGELAESSFVLELIASAPRSFVHQLLESVRVHHGLRGELPGPHGAHSVIDLIELHRSVVGTGGIERLLDHAEYLEQAGLSRAALDLLRGPVRLWDLARPSQRARRIVSIAHALFRSDRVGGAERALAEIAPQSLDPELKSKWHFVYGRCLQYRQLYSWAESEFVQGAANPSVYGFKCRHQVAFIRFFVASDFARAAELLGGIVPNPFVSEEQDRAGESRLLLANCQVQLGQLEQAEQALLEIVSAAHRSRLRHREATGWRILADLYLREFRSEAALEAAERCLEHRRKSAHRLGAVYAFDIRARALSLLEGDLVAAHRSVEEALTIASELRHGPSLSWMLQTRAQVRAVTGERRGAVEDLIEARTHGLSPLQKMRTLWILWLARATVGSPGDARPAGTGRLLSVAIRRGSARYGGLLRLGQACLEGSLPGSDRALSELLPHRIDPRGARRSFLVARLTSARAQPGRGDENRAG